MIQFNQIRIFQGECQKIIPTLGKTYQLIFADPPFNIGQDYDGYTDDLHPDLYRSRLTGWVHQLWDVCDGVLCLHGPDDLAELYLSTAPYCHNMKRIAWVNWHYRFGQCSRSNWIDARCHCLIYARPNYTWNPEDVLVESDRVAYGDKRIHETENGGKRLPGTIWGVPSDGPYWGRIQGQNKERRQNHPNQLPEVYLARLIKAYTNRGDSILDPFGGSGTTAVVADKLDRKCDTIDISQANCESILERLKSGAVRV